MVCLSVSDMRAVDVILGPMLSDNCLELFTIFQCFLLNEAHVLIDKFLSFFQGILVHNYKTSQQVNWPVVGRRAADGLWISH